MKWIIGIISVCFILLYLIFYVESKPVDAGNAKGTFMQESAITEENQKKLLESTPIPKVETSQERKNLIRRIETWNKEDKISYIYLVNYGKVMAFYTVKGKVSSLDSMLTNPEQVINGDGRQGKDSWCNSGQCYTVSSPQIDGSYGTNGDGIFFYTTEGVYVEAKSDYILADQPLKITTPVELTREIK